jgi:hypothetical protein
MSAHKPSQNQRPLKQFLLAVRRFRAQVAAQQEEIRIVPAKLPLMEEIAVIKQSISRSAAQYESMAGRTGHTRINPESEPMWDDWIDRPGTYASVSAELSTFIEARIEAFPIEAPASSREEAPFVAESSALPLYRGFGETTGIRPDGD